MTNRDIGITFLKLLGVYLIVTGVVLFISVLTSLFDVSDWSMRIPFLMGNIVYIGAPLFYVFSGYCLIRRAESVVSMLFGEGGEEQLKCSITSKEFYAIVCSLLGIYFFVTGIPQLAIAGVNFKTVSSSSFLSDMDSAEMMRNMNWRYLGPVLGALLQLIIALFLFFGAPVISNFWHHQLKKIEPKAPESRTD